MSSLDFFVVGAYFALILALGIWAGLRKQGKSGAGGYFLAGRSLGWPMIGLALFATNISCVHLVSLAQSGYDSGLLYGNFEWMAAFTLLLLGFFFVPFYIRSGITTLPDFLEKRYDRACRDWLAVISLLSAVVVHIGFSFLTGGIFLEALFGIDRYTGILFVAALTGIYTIIGGLAAVVATEALQAVVLVLGALVVTVISLHAAGGWEGMMEVLRSRGETVRLSMLRGPGEPGGMPWYSVWLGYPVLGIWYWCADQTIVQRVLGAKDVNHARMGPIFAGFIKILPVFLFVLPGLLAWVLAAQGRLDLSSLSRPGPGGTIQVDSKGIYGVMVTQLLPRGLTGLMVAALLAALMSTVSGALNSISTLVSYDLYKRFRPGVSDRRLVAVGRISAGAALLLSIGLVPLLDSYESLFQGINDVIAHLAPPVTAVFLLGVFWPRASAGGARATLWIGSALGVAVYAGAAIGKGLSAGGGGLGGAARFLAGIPFMMRAFYLFLACSVILVATSLASPKREGEDKEGLSWSNPLAALREGGGWGYKVMGGLLVVVMALLYWIFR